MSTVTADELLRMKKKLEERTAERDRADGALKQSLKTLKEEFGVKDLPAAKIKLEELSDVLHAAQTTLNEKLAAFKEKYQL